MNGLLETEETEMAKSTFRRETVNPRFLSLIDFFAKSEVNVNCHFLQKKC